MEGFFHLELRKFGGAIVFQGNLYKKDINNLNIEEENTPKEHSLNLRISTKLAISCCVKEVIETWSEIFFEKEIVSKDHFLSLPLCKIH